MKHLIAGVSAFLAVTIAVAGNRVPKKIHVPEHFDCSRTIVPKAATLNHILVVNVANAIPANDWANIVGFVESRVHLNIWTNSIEMTIFPDVEQQPGVIAKRFGDRAKLSVFIEDADVPISYVSSPGKWCRVNLRSLSADNPDRQTLRDRWAKALLKGIAYAAGCGAGYDQISVTGFETQTLAGLDKASIAITPEVYFPMLEMMMRIGGEEITQPPTVAQ